MNDDANKFDCLTFKKLFEGSECGQVLSPQDQSRLDLHAGNCGSCSRLLKHHTEIVELAKHMPQFDVSEGLTQKILDSIEKQNTPGVQTSLLPLGLVASVVFLVFVPFDTWQSLYGWGAGILGLIILQLLMKTANTQEQIT
jgi:hypothetical protein